jgi:hypothetical protein
MVDHGVLDRSSDDAGVAAPGSKGSIGGATDDRRSKGVALGVFVVYLVVAFFVLLSIGGRRYFFVDDWDFLASRSLSSIGDVLRSHNGHWSTLPIVEYRVLYHFFGLEYGPYLVVGIVAHLSAAGLLRWVMRRCHVGPWTATVFAGVLVLFGAGADEILAAFQVAFVAAFAFGLAQLLLTNHQGPIGRRDWLALLVGLGALMSSGVGLSMVAGVGVAVLVARGWRAAIFNVAPLAVIFAIWSQTVAQIPATGGRPTVAVELKWIGISLAGAYTGIGQHPVVAGALALLTVSGLALAWWPLDRPARRRQASMPVGLVVSAILFAATTGYTRWFFGTSGATVGRYLYIIAGCLLVALAVAADAVIRRWPLSTPIMLAIVVIGVPGNIRALDDNSVAAPGSLQRHTVAAIARIPLARQVPRWVRISAHPYQTGQLTIGQLLDELDAGRLPDPGPPVPTIDAQLPLRLSLAQTTANPTGRCTNYNHSVDMHLRQGDRVGFNSPIDVALLHDGTLVSTPVAFDPTFGATLVTEVPDLEIRISQHPVVLFALCP